MKGTKKINVSLSVILPCFNEAKNIRKNLRTIYTYLNEKLLNFEIIAVNDGSTDATLLELQKSKQKDSIPLFIIDKKQNEGKGKAVQDGILQSKKSIVMFMDADLAIPIDELTDFLKEIKNNNDIVIASRFISKIKILRPILWYRNIMEKIFRILRMVIINDYNIQDTQCGFKVFTRESAMKIFSLLTVKRFSFDVEIIYLAQKMGYKIKELPITLQNPPESHIRIWKDSINMFFDLIRIRINDIRGKYKTKSRTF